MDSSKIRLAKMYCVEFHKGKFRKGNNEPYHTHPFAVASLLKMYGYDEPVTQCIAYLHDTVEDTAVKMDKIQQVFGYEVSNGVYILSRNKGKIETGKKLSHKDYLTRLSFARGTIQRVKIADVVDNTRDLENLKPESIEKKINDAMNYYIPWEKEVAPLMIKELEQNITNYKQKLLLCP